MFQKYFTDRWSESINKITKGNVKHQGGVACTATDVKQGNVKKVGLPGVSGGDEGRVQGVSLKGATVGKIEGWLRRYLYMGNLTTDGALPSVIGLQICCLSSSTRKYWCGWIGDRF